ncbi:hypothetical protein [Stackebrandtia nassauensis]|uniref:HTH cro/C1-type domain-containing protein n=1 Tax=Stackebrandtia nassauensis (strain DSM 44728 / CIP 108903 / NRRL B-16338 / NBRC 102104 / LLR-40K-21) TaxID=446470 RepID=D3Q2C4_STANL|nr:hypothetical protein [Stackebrandtia nassauensis]ADD43857.1 hypothetical protein Snas_4208 [Stackebrandtia nassauensis DSM 44728]
MGKRSRVHINVEAVKAALTAQGAVGVCAQARRIGITREAWGRICAGKLKTTPRTETLARIVAATGLNYSSVIAHND